MAYNKASSKPELSCLAQYRRMIKFLGVCAKLCGANVMDSNFRINWVTYAVGTIVFNFFCCTTYTIYVGITNEGDITVVLQTLCFAGAGFQAGVKLVCFIAHAETIREMERFMDETFMTYESRGKRYCDALNKGLLNTMRFFKLFMGMNLTVVVACSTIPVVYYAIYQEKIMIMQFLLPGVDPNTNTGYFLLTTMHFVSLSIGAFGTFAGDMYLLTVVGNIPLLKDILGCKFDEVNIILDREIKPTEEELQSSIVEVLVWHQKYIRILAYADSVFFIVIFAYIVSSAAGIMCTLYCMLAGAWPAAPFMLGYSYLCLYAYCALGTIVDNANEDCSDLIYTQCRWYDLPVREQRCILLMLRVSQTTSSLSIGCMMPLNVATGLQLTKAIFSLVMLLLSTEDDV